MVKVIKYGVTHKGSVVGVGAVIDDLKAKDEKRLVDEKWCEFVEKEQSDTEQPEQSENKEEEQSEAEQEEQSETEKPEQSEDEQPKTEMPSSTKWL